MFNPRLVVRFIGLLSLGYGALNSAAARAQNVTLVQGQLLQNTQSVGRDRLLEPQQRARVSLLRISINDALIPFYGGSLTTSHAFIRWSEFDTQRTALLNLSGNLFALYPWPDNRFVSSFVLSASRLNGAAALPGPTLLSSLSWKASEEWKWKLLLGGKFDRAAERPVFATAGFDWFPSERLQVSALLPVFLVVKRPALETSVGYEFFLSSMDATTFSFSKPELNPAFNNDVLFRKTGFKLGARASTQLKRIEFSAGAGLTTQQKAKVFTVKNEIQTTSLNRAFFVEFELKVPSLKGQKDAPSESTDEFSDVETLL